MEIRMKNIEKGKTLELKDQVQYQDGQVVSKTLAQNPHVSLTLFAVDTICLALLCRFVFGGFTDSIMDFFMHAWVIYELYVGIRAARNLDE